MTTRHILAVDPGKATGVCLFSIEKGEDPTLMFSWEVTMETFAQIVRWALKAYPGTEVVCEKFTITARTAKLTQAPYSLEHIGILKQCMMDEKLDYENLPLQTPTDAKAMFPNPALKKLGYWHRGGAGHALDSIRHGLLYMVRTGWKPSAIFK